MFRKKVVWTLLGGILLIFLLINITNCDVLDLCGGRGYLRLTNESRNTLHRIRIDGVNHGTLDPGESKTFDLTIGKHTVETIDITHGGNACSPFEVTIVECDTQGYSCSR